MSTEIIYNNNRYKSISSLAKSLDLDYKSLQRWMRRDNRNVDLAVKNATAWRDNPQPQIPKNRKAVTIKGFFYPSVKIAMQELPVKHIVYSTVLKRMKKGQAYKLPPPSCAWKRFCGFNR